MSYKNIALIVAGGNGSRVGNYIPKQYIKINNKAIIRYTIERFLNNKNIDFVQVVIRQEDIDLYKEAVNGLDIPEYIIGGVRRQDSVLNGLNALAKYNPENILVHDAVRIFTSNTIIDQVIKALEHYNAVVPIIPIRDTIKEIDKLNQTVVNTIDRDKYGLVQTPQGFKYKIIYELYQNSDANNNYTDDASLFEKLSLEVKYIPGEDSNFKITYPEDIKRAISLI